MKTIKKILSVALCLVLGSCIAACGGDSSGSEDQIKINKLSSLADYDNAGGVMDIYAYFPSDDRDGLKAMLDAGFNSVLMTRPNTYITTNKAHLKETMDILEDLSETYDFKVYPFTGHMLSDTNFDGEFYSYLTDYKCLGGLYIYDEPYPNTLASIGDASLDFIDSEKYGKDYKFLVTMHPSTVTESSKWTWKDVSYEDLIVDYYDEVVRNFGDKSRVWMSADIYPIVGGEGGLGKRTLKPSYLYNVGVIASYAKKYGLESNIALQALDHINYPEPTLQDLRLQLNTLLAFGIDTYSVYTFDTPTLTYPGEENRQGCYKDGEPTAIYGRMKQLNTEMRAWQSVYKSFEWQGIIPCSTENSANDTAFRLLKSVADDERLLVSTILDNTDTVLVKGFSSTGDSLLGYFSDKNGNEGFMITNYAETQSGKSSTATVTFKGCNKAYVYRNGAKQTVELKNGVLTIELAAGDGAFVIPFAQN